MAEKTSRSRLNPTIFDKLVADNTISGMRGSELEELDEQSPLNQYFSLPQLERFNDRQNTPEKQWKITEEDWRNREKWDQYEVAVNEMIQKTSTTFAPWHVLESVDKKYARIKALRIVVEELERALK